jgi:hypothetical protein
MIFADDFSGLTRAAVSAKPPCPEKTTAFFIKMNPKQPGVSFLFAYKHKHTKTYRRRPVIAGKDTRAPKLILRLLRLWQ